MISIEFYCEHVSITSKISQQCRCYQQHQCERLLIENCPKYIIYNSASFFLSFMGLLFLLLLLFVPLLHLTLGDLFYTINNITGNKRKKCFEQNNNTKFSVCCFCWLCRYTYVVSDCFFLCMFIYIHKYIIIYI